VNSNSKEIAKLKKKYSKWPIDRGSAGFNTKILVLLPAMLTTMLLKRFLRKSEYKLKRESIKFFQLCNRAYGERKFRKCRRLLRIAINLLGSNFPISYKILLSNAISETSKDARNRVLISDAVLLATKLLEPAIFDATGWYQLSRGLFSLGYFRAAWVARENSLDLSIDEGSKSSSSPTAVSRAIEAHLERLNLESVKKLLELTDKISRKSFDSFRDYMNLIERSSVKYRVDEPITASVQEQLFHKLVHNKRVSLVGPGHPHGEHGIEIDSAQTIARVKFVGEKNLPDSKFHGSRCNIAYQAAISPLAKFIELGMNINFYENIDLFVSNSELSNFCGKPVMNVNLLIPMYRTTAVSGIVMLYQLIRTCPIMLKVYGYDFRSSRKQYSDAARDFYKENGVILGHPHPGFDREKLPEWLVALDFSEHDFVSNFCFAQNLYKSGLFDIEPYGKSILELTPYQYVERLEEMLGDW